MSSTNGGNNGYYTDVLPVDADLIQEGDTKLAKQVVVLEAGAIFVISIFDVVLYII